jgi:Zn finger protein HypA/HybF involved in hydrogenase expression
MHDTYLLNKISKTLQKLCIENKIKKVRYLKIIVSFNSHINVKNLSEHLLIHNKELINQDFKIEIIKDNIDEQTAIIETIQGE